MTTPPDPVVRETTIREVQPGIAGALTEIGRGLIVALPPSFLGLLLINTIFIAVVFRHLEHAADNRSAAINRLLDHCLASRLPHPAAANLDLAMPNLKR